jgi:hypothetical protein
MKIKDVMNRLGVGKHPIKATNPKKTYELDIFLYDEEGNEVVRKTALWYITKMQIESVGDIHFPCFTSLTKLVGYIVVDEDEEKVVWGKFKVKDQIVNKEDTVTLRGFALDITL